MKVHRAWGKKAPGPPQAVFHAMKQVWKGLIKLWFYSTLMYDSAFRVCGQKQSTGIIVCGFVVQRKAILTHICVYSDHTFKFKGT